MIIDKEINKLRFLLIILVVLIHSHNIGLNEGDNSEVSVYYTGFDYILTQAITIIACPGLFMISGYLFCHNMREWDTSVYLSKMRRRVQSIFIPFIIWNTLKLSILLVKGYLSNGVNGIATVFNEYNGWHILWDGGMPYHSPVMLVTWYLRDLMVFLLFVPILHLLIQKTLVLPYIFIALCSVYDFWPTDHVCVAYNLSFFTLGMTIALHKRNKEVSDVTTMTITLCAVVGGIALIMTENEWIEFISIPLIILSLYLQMHHIYLPKKSVEASMFIYLAHGLYFHSFCRIVVWQIIPYSGTLYSIIRLLIIPILTISLLTILYATLQQYAIKTLRVLTGNRQSHPEGLL